MDINERHVALTALDRETMETKGTLVLDYGRVNQERQRYHTTTTRCQYGDMARDSYGYGGCVLQLEDVFVLW